MYPTYYNPVIVEKTNTPQTTISHETELAIQRSHENEHFSDKVKKTLDFVDDELVKLPDVIHHGFDKVTHRKHHE
ncbi:hypothetical protein Cantr_06313 [Candida viswanathii]|uniref:Uncharacterized protein n=1 Tax=Candida viswanathii TaxID=5486 RepID=A0A367XWM0_9ASCO|nr:hypothetical protein Cantr_06313 [Candida viswanathii]